MRTTILLAVIFIFLVGSSAAQQDTIWKKKLYKTWLKLNKERVEQKGVLYEIQDSSVLLSDAKHNADYLDGKYKVSKVDVSSIENIRIRRVRRVENASLIGFLTGFVAGGLTAAIIAASTSTNAAGAIVMLGAWTAGLGAAIGAVIGSVKISIPINGSQAMFDKNRKKLRTYAIKSQQIPIPQAYFTRLQGSVTDADGNMYQTFVLAGQVWMAGDLRVSHFRNGESIMKENSKRDWEGIAAGASSDYPDDSATGKKPGLLYNWNAVIDSRGLCPQGWHVPSLSEWSSLVVCLGGQSEAGKKLTEPVPAVSGSLSDDPFALPERFRYANGEFSSAKGLSYQWWSSTSADSLKAKAIFLGNADGGIMFSDTDKHSGLPVKCLRD